MLELISVDLTNFRSFSQAEFAPLGIGQGMTAINGVNGAGKSSIVHGLLFALFGVTPDGVPVRALRRQGSEGEVVATATFRHDGQTVVATRALRGRNDTTMAAISVDGVEQTNISAKTATAWMEKRLGLDAEAFLTAFVVRQKELDSLVRARPADRRKTIERLAGIERMSAALDLARRDARDAERTLAALPSAVDPARAEQALVKASEQVLTAQNAEAELAQAGEQTQTAADASTTALNDARQQAQRVTALEADLAVLRERASTYSRDVERLTALADKAGDTDALRALALNATQARQEAETAAHDAQLATQKLEAASARLDDLRGNVERAERALSEATTRLKAIPEPVAPVGELELRIKTLTAEAEEVAEKRGAARGEWDRLRKSIETLEAANASHAAECPTCAHPLADADALIASQRSAMEFIASTGKDLSAQYDDLNARVQQSRAELNLARESERDTEQAHADHERAQIALTQAIETLEAHSTQVEPLTEAATTAQNAAAAATKGLPALRDAEQEAHGQLRDAEQAADAVTSLSSARTALEEVTEQTEEKTAELANLAANPAEAIVDLEAAAQSAANQARQAQQAASDARMAVAMAQRDEQAAHTELERARDIAATRRTALADVERTQAAAKALEEFRRNRLAHLGPEMSEVASDFVSRMTDGRYIAVELDEDFTPILTEASGAQRPAAWLSGGEESAVALALRVAIGEVLAGQRGGLLILDEVLTAQDTQRRQATMGAIRALPRQIITINHVSESTDMVDLVADVVPDGEGASTIVAWTPDHVASNDLASVLTDA